MRDSRAKYRARAAAAERLIDQGLAEAAVAREAEAAKARTEYAEKNKPVPYTPEELAGARAVRTIYGWWRVRRVNKATVTVAGGFGDMRVPHNQVLEVRS